MKFTQNIYPTHLFGPTRLIGTWEYSLQLYTVCSFYHKFPSYGGTGLNYQPPFNELLNEKSPKCVETFEK